MWLNKHKKMALPNPGVDIILSFKELDTPFSLKLNFQAPSALATKYWNLLDTQKTYNVLNQRRTLDGQLKQIPNLMPRC
jgi:hypothetical protein